MNKDLILNVRRYKGMTQEEFAEWLGVSRMTIALIESEHRNVSDTVTSKLAHKFDVTDDDFLTYCERRKKTSKYFLT